MTFEELLKQSKMNMRQFAAYFDIPYGTIQHWAYGDRRCPEYLLKLMKYKLNIEKHKADLVKLGAYLADKEDTDIALMHNAGLDTWPSAIIEELEK